MTHNKQRRKLIQRSLSVAAPALVWSAPVVHSVVLPAHAQTSMLPVLCAREDIPGIWRFELFGQAASVRTIEFFDDGRTGQDLIANWRYDDDQLTIAQGITWLYNGTFSDNMNSCEQMTGTYANTVVIPPLGNIVIRRGEWQARRVIRL